MLYNSNSEWAHGYSQAFNGPEITQFGNAVNLASNPTSAQAGKATVRMVNFGPSAFTTPVKLSIYGLGEGGVVGSLIAEDTETISVPAGPHAFNAQFDLSSAHVVLPSTVVYGVTLNELKTDCETTPSDCGNDPNPVGSLNVALSENVSSGTNVYPGDVFVSSAQADEAGSALESNLGECPGHPTGALTTFQGVPVSCGAGYGTQTVGLGIEEYPAVELTTG